MKSKFFFACLFSLIVLGGNGCASEMKTITIAGKVAMRTPSSVEVEEKSPVEDFVLLKFRRNGILFLSAYIGNAPSFPGADCEGDAIVGKVGRFASKRVTGKVGTSCHEELLIQLREGDGWPKYAHFRIEKGEKALVLEAVAIIESVEDLEASVRPSGPAQ